MAWLSRGACSGMAGSSPFLGVLFGVCDRDRVVIEGARVCAGRGIPKMRHTLLRVLWVWQPHRRDDSLHSKHIRTLRWLDSHGHPFACPTLGVSVSWALSGAFALPWTRPWCLSTPPMQRGRRRSGVNGAAHPQHTQTWGSVRAVSLLGSVAPCCPRCVVPPLSGARAWGALPMLVCARS